MVSADDVIQLVRTVNSFWLGYRYVIISMPESVSFDSIRNAASLASLGITEFQLPSTEVEFLTVPSLSVRERIVPVGVKYGDLILRAPTFRNSAFYNRIQSQVAAVDEPLLPSYSETIVISEFEVSNTISDIVPIAVWICYGAQAFTYLPASANAQGSGSVPLEELRFKVRSIERL